MQRLLVLRAGFTLLFCLLLGIFGLRVTGRVWAAALVHGAGVAFMLAQDVPAALLLAHWPVAVGIVLLVALLTLAASWGARVLAQRKKRRRGR